MRSVAERFITVRRLAWLVGIALAVLVINVAISVLYMVIYSYLIDPGHEPNYYNEHIQRAAPYCSIVAGMPLMFIAGRWVSGWWQGQFGFKSALLVWFAYAVIDIAIILLAGGLTSAFSVLVGVSLVTKLAAAYIGAISKAP